MNGQVLDRAIERHAVRRQLPAPEEIRFHRRRAGLSQRELAEAIGVDRSAVALWERGARAPSAENACEILAALERLRHAV